MVDGGVAKECDLRGEKGGRLPNDPEQISMHNAAE